MRYHVTIDRQGSQWRAVCPALKVHGAVTGGETREEALVHIQSVISMILANLEPGGVSLPPDELVPDGILLTIEDE